MRDLASLGPAWFNSFADRLPSLANVLATDRRALQELNPMCECSLTLAFAWFNSLAGRFSRLAVARRRNGRCRS